MKKIMLNKGYVAFVDDEDFLPLTTFTGVYRYKKNKPRKWFVRIAPDGQLYAVGNRRVSLDRWLPEKMHRVILKIQDPKIRVDHIDGNGLNNQKQNLRIASNMENARNMKKPKGRLGKKPSSKFKGVSLHRQTNKWCASIRVAGKQKHLGLFTTQSAAARAYDAAAERYFGIFARLNHVVTTGTI